MLCNLWSSRISRKNVEIEYLEAVEEFGKESKNIKFKIIPETKAISVDHKGPYSKLRDVYAFALNYIKEKDTLLPTNQEKFM